MVIFESPSPYPYSFVYVKPKGKNPYSIPLNEVLDGTLVTDQITPESIVMKTGDGGKTEEGLDAAPTYTTYTRDGLKGYLEKKLKLGELEAIAVQPEGEAMVEEVYEFMDKYLH